MLISDRIEITDVSCNWNRTAAITFLKGEIIIGIKRIFLLIPIGKQILGHWNYQSSPLSFTGIPK